MKKTLKLGHLFLRDYEPHYNLPAEDGLDLSDLVIFWIKEQSHRLAGIWESATHHVEFSVWPEDRPALYRGDEGWLELRLLAGLQGECPKLLCTLDEWERIHAAELEYNETEF